VSDGRAARPEGLATLLPLGGVAAGIGIAAWIETVDPIGLMVQGFVSDIPWSEAGAAFALPPPNYGHGWRPLSVAIAKAVVAAFGAYAPTPAAFFGIKAALSSLL
jgi:hypothetical protein